MSQWNYLKLEIGILDSVLRQWNDFEDFIYNFCKINGADFLVTRLENYHLQNRIKLKLASLLWLSTDEANRSQVIWEQFARR